MSRRKIFLLLNSVWAVPAVFILRLVRPILLIRTGQFFSERIGHFIADTSEQLIRKELSRTKSIDLWSVREISNRQWFAMISRTIRIYGMWAGILNDWNCFIPGGKIHKIPRTYSGSRDPEGLFAKHQAGIPFLPGEDECAKNWLMEKGWQEGEPFVCLLVRDAAYTLTLNPPPTDLMVTNYRNSKIADYTTAIDWLTSQGIWVVRMGKVSQERVPFDSPYLIDYSFDLGKSDLLDIWLFANCTGCITTGAGLDILCPIYHKPLLYVNALPLWHLNASADAIWVPKNLTWENSGKPLSLTEYLNCSAMSDSEYASCGVKVQDLSPSEIVSVVEEFWLRVTNVWNETQDELKSQEKFWTILKSWSKFESSFFSWKHPNFRIGASWLRWQQDLFLTSDQIEK